MRHRGARRRRSTLLRVRAVLAGGLVLGIGAALTLAAWTDQEVAGAEITAGTFTVQSRTATTAWGDHTTAAPAALTFGAAGMYPGDTRAAWVALRNTGSVNGAASVSGVTVTLGGAENRHAAFRDAVAVRAVTTAWSGTGDPTCTVATVGAQQAVALTTVPEAVATPTSLPAGGHVAVCIVIALASDAPNAAQGGQIEATWTLAAESTGG